MFLAAAAVDGSLQPLVDAFVDSSTAPRHRGLDAISSGVIAAQSIMLTVLHAEFRAWVGAELCPPPPHVQLFKGAHHLPDDTSMWPITSWLDRLRDGFGWRFSSAFVHLQMPMVWSMRRRVHGVSGLLRRHLFARLSQRLGDLGASRAELRAIITAVDTDARGHIDSTDPTEVDTTDASDDAATPPTDAEVADVAPDATAAAAAVAKGVVDASDPEERATKRQRTTNPVLFQLLLGTHDKCSPLSVLRGNHDVLEVIWMHVLDL